MYWESQQCYAGSGGDPVKWYSASIRSTRFRSKSPKWCRHETVYTTAFALQGYHTSKAHKESIYAGRNRRKKSLQVQNIFIYLKYRKNRKVARATRGSHRYVDEASLLHNGDCSRFNLDSTLIIRNRECSMTCLQIIHIGWNRYG